MLAHEINIGDVIEMPLKGGKAYAPVEKIYVMDAGVIAFTADTMAIAEPESEFVQFYGSDHSSVNMMEGAEKMEKMMEKSVEARKLNGYWTIACLAVNLGIEIWNFVNGLANLDEMSWEDVAAMVVGEFIGMIADNIGMGACGKAVMAVMGMASQL